MRGNVPSKRIFAACFFIRLADKFHQYPSLPFILRCKSSVASIGSGYPLPKKHLLGSASNPICFYKLLSIELPRMKWKKQEM